MIGLLSRFGIVVLGAVLGLVVVGCSAGSEDSTAPTAVGNVTTTARALVTTVPSAEGTSIEEEPQGSSELVIGVDEVIRFASGGSSAVISDAVVVGERNRYTLEAAAGQTMNVDVVSLENNAVFDVYGPGDTLLAGETMTASIVLPESGVYILILGATRGNASYDLTVEIPAG